MPKIDTKGLLVPSRIYGTLSAGRPSLFIGPTDCEVGRIVLDSRSGFVVEPGGVESAFNALTSLVRSVALRCEMGRNAKEYYEHHFGRQKSVAQIVSILERVAGNGQLDSRQVPLIDKGLEDDK